MAKDIDYGALLDADLQRAGVVPATADIPASGDVPVEPVIDYGALLDSDLSPQAVEPQSTPERTDYLRAQNLRTKPLDPRGPDSQPRTLRDRAYDLTKTHFSGGGERVAAAEVAPEDRAAFEQMFHEELKRERPAEDLGFVGRTSMSVFKGLEQFGENVAAWTGADPTELDPDQTLFRDRLNAIRQGLDPLVDQDAPWYKRGFHAAANQAIPMAMSQAAGGALGTGAKALGLGKFGVGAAQATGVGATFYKQMRDQTYVDLLKEGMEPEVAGRAAAISGILQGAAESIPVTNPFARRMGSTAINKTIRDVVVSNLKRFGGEMGEEALQGMVDETVKEVARRSIGEGGDVGAVEVMAEGLKQAWESVPTLLFLMGPGMVAGGTAEAGGVFARGERLEQQKEFKEQIAPADRRLVKTTQRLKKMEQLRTEEKKYVTREEGKALKFTSAEMKNRESRNKALDKRIQQTRQELQDAIQKREAESQDRTEIPVSEILAQPQGTSSANDSPLDDGPGPVSAPPAKVELPVSDVLAGQTPEAVEKIWRDRVPNAPKIAPDKSAMLKQIQESYSDAVQQAPAAGTESGDAEVQSSEVPGVSQPGTLPGTYDDPAESTNSPDEHEDMKRKGAGWKLHLTVTPENRSEVTQKLREKGLKFKEGRSGDQAGKDYTVYVGSKDKADRISQEIELELGNLLDTPDLIEDQSFTGKVMGRFDAATDEFHQYGVGGVPALMSQVKSDMGKGMKEYDYDKVRRVLEKRFGEFFSGTMETGEAEVQVKKKHQTPRAFLTEKFPDAPELNDPRFDVEHAARQHGWKPEEVSPEQLQKEDIGLMLHQAQAENEGFAIPPMTLEDIEMEVDHLELKIQRGKRVSRYDLRALNQRGSVANRLNDALEADPDSFIAELRKQVDAAKARGEVTPPPRVEQPAPASKPLAAPEVKPQDDAYQAVDEFTDAIDEDAAEPAGEVAPDEESPWASETRQRLAGVPAFKDSSVELDEKAGSAKVTRPDGRVVTIYMNADEELVAIAKKRSRKPDSVKGAYVYKKGKKGKYQEGSIYLRSDAGHGTLNHEAIHWLEDEGIVTPEEVEKYGGREGIATKYAEWAASKQRKPDTILQKIYDFLEPVFSSQRRFFDDIGKRQGEARPDVSESAAPEVETAPAKPARRQELEAMDTDDLRPLAPKGTRSRNKKGLIDAILEATVPEADTPAEEDAGLAAAFDQGLEEKLGKAPKTAPQTYQEMNAEINRLTDQAAPLYSKEATAEQGQKLDAQAHVLREKMKEQIRDDVRKALPENMTMATEDMVSRVQDRVVAGEDLQQVVDDEVKATEEETAKFQAEQEAKEEKHRSGIPISEVVELTGLKPTSPALHNTGLPRENDVELDATVSDGTTTGTVSQRWRTASANADDGLLHLTLDIDGKRQGFTGKEAEKFTTASESLQAPVAPDQTPKSEKVTRVVTDEALTETPDIPAFTRTTEAGGITRQDRQQRIADIQKKTSDVERDIREARKSRDGLRRNATRKRAAADQQIRKLQNQEREYRNSIEEDERLETVTKLEDALESPKSYDHYLAGMMGWHRANNRDREGDQFSAKLQARVKEVAQSKGFDEGDASQIALSAANTFTVFEDRSLEEIVDLHGNRVRESRVSQEIGKLFPSSVYGREPDLSPEQREGFKAKYQEASLDDEGWLEKRKEIDKEVDEQIAANRKAAKDAEESTRKAAADEKSKGEREKLSTAREKAREKSKQERLEKGIKGRKVATEKVFVREDEGKYLPSPAKRTNDDRKAESYPSVGMTVVPSLDENGKADGGWMVVHTNTGLRAQNVNSKTDAVLLVKMMDVLGMDMSGFKTAEEIPSEFTSRMNKVFKAWEALPDISAMSEEDQAAFDPLVAETPTTVDADMVLNFDDLNALAPKTYTVREKGDDGKAKDVTKSHKTPVQFVKELAADFPEFAYDPVFTFQNGKLVFRDGYKIEFDPTVFNIHPSELTEGQTVGINLEDLGIKRKTPKDVVGNVLENAGFIKVTRRDNKQGVSVVATMGVNKVTLRKGEEDNDWTVEGKGKAAVEATAALKKIRWRQPGQAGDPNTDLEGDKPFGAESLQEHMGITAEQAEVTVIIAESKGHDLPRIVLGTRDSATDTGLKQIGKAADKMAETGKRYGNEEEFFAMWDKVLTAVQGKRLGLKSTKRAVDEAVEQMATWLENNPHFLDYYAKDMRAERRQMVKIDPALRNDAEWALFKVVSGIASNNAPLKGNVSEQIDAWMSYSKSGRIDASAAKRLTKGRMVWAVDKAGFTMHGGAQGVHALHYQTLNRIIKEQGGAEGAVSWLLDSVKSTPSGINGARKSVGLGDMNGTNRFHLKNTQDAATGQRKTVPRALALFGPKVGSYVLNHLGKSEYTTVDVWESRFWRSFFKQDPDKPFVTGIEDDAETRAAYIRAANAFAEHLNLSPSAAQAARWFYVIQQMNKAGYNYAQPKEKISTYTKAAIAKKLASGTGGTRRQRQAAKPTRGRKSSTLRSLLGEDFFTGRTPDRLTQDQDRLNQAAPNRWHLKSRQLVEQKMGPKGTPGQVLAMLKKNGVKAEELEWMGLSELLGGTSLKSVTKEQVLAAIDVGVEVKEVVRSDADTSSPDTSTMSRAELAREYERIVGYDPIEDDPSITMEDMRASLEERIQEGQVYGEGAGTKYGKSDYVLPGGTDHVEIAMYVPNIEQYSGEDAAHFGDLTDQRGVVWIRGNTRTDTDGKKMFFVEEGQSKRHQEGRKRGYADDTTLQGKLAEADDIESRHNDLIKEIQKRQGDDSFDSYSAINESNRLHAEAARIRAEARREHSGGVPNAPFKKTWPMLAMKRAIQWAAENGFDRVGWTTGEQQADRYDLSKQVDVVSYNVTNQKLTAGKQTANGVENLLTETVPPDKLADYIGKDAAEKLLSQPAKINKSGEWHTLRGNDLKVGGEGMKSFYDKMLPNEVNKFVKKFGAKVGQATIETVPGMGVYKGQDFTIEKDEATGTYAVYDAELDKPVIENLDSRADAVSAMSGLYVIVDGAGENVGEGPWFDQQEAQDFLEAEVGAQGARVVTLGEEAGARQDVHAFDITPKMRDSAVDQGQPLFQDQEGASGVKAFVDFAQYKESGRILIAAVRNPDVSSALHELAHVTRRERLMEPNGDITQEDIDLLDEWVSEETGIPVKDGKWTTQHEELFARGTERYYYDGVAPTKALEPIFAKLAKWMNEIYQTLKDSPIDVEIGPVRHIFDKLHTREEAGRPDGSRPGSDRLYQAAERSADDFGDASKRSMGPKSAANEAAAAKMVQRVLAAGMEFDEMMQILEQKVGETRAAKLRPMVQKQWDMQVDHRSPPDEPPRPHPEVAYARMETTGTKNVKTDEMREQLGLGPRPMGEKGRILEPQTIEEWDEWAKQKMADDPLYAPRLAERVSKDPTARLGPGDTAVVGRYLREMNNRGSTDYDAIRTAIEAAESAGVQWGQEGVARQVELAADFSLTGLARKHSAEVGEQPSDEQMAEYEGMAKQIKDLKGKLEEAEKGQVIDEQIKKDTPKRGRKKKSIPEAAKKVIDSFKSKWQAFAKAGNKYDPVTDQPDRLAQAGRAQDEMLRAATEVIEAVGQDHASFATFWESIKADIGEDAEPVFRDAWSQLKDSGVVGADVDPGNKAELSKLAREIQQAYVEAGMRDRDEVIAAVHEAMGELVPGITLDETVDALSKYGQFTTPSKEDVDTIIREMNAEILKLAQIRDAEIALERAKELRQQNKNMSDEEIGNKLLDEDLLVKATGFLPDKPHNAVRDLTKVYSELKKGIPASSEGIEGTLQTALAAMERSLNNRIRDVQKEIADRKPIVRNKREQRTSPTTDRLKAELEVLLEARDALPEWQQMNEEQRVRSAEKGAEKVLAALQAEAEAGFPAKDPQGPGPSSDKLSALRTQIEGIRKQRDAAQREGKRVESLDQQIEALEQKIELEQQGVDTAKKPTLEHLPLAEAAREAFRMQLQAELAALRNAKKPKMPKDERYRRAYEASLKKRIAKYEDMIARGEFDPAPKKEPRKLSQTEIDLKLQLANKKHDFFEKVDERRLEKLSPVGKGLDAVQQTAHLSRAMMTSIDLSAVLRQGGLAAYSHPILAQKAAGEMMKSIAGADWQNLSVEEGRKAELASMEKLKNDPVVQFGMENGLDITESEGKLQSQEEAFMGRWVRQGIGKKGTKLNTASKVALEPVAASARAYTTFLNNMRASLFKQMVENLGRNGQVTADEAKLLASYVNVLTGRSDFKYFNKAAAAVNAWFFAPRYVASRFQFLGKGAHLLGQEVAAGVSPKMRASLEKKTSRRVRRLMLAEYSRTFIGAATFIGSAVALGALLTDDDDDKPWVELNPLSPDFLKIRIGETRLDPMAGLSQVIVFSSRMWWGASKSSVTGDIKKFGERGPIGIQHRADLGIRFLRTKAAPIPGAAWTVLTRDDEGKMTNVVGEEETPLSLTAGMFIPLSTREIYDAMKHRGIPQGVALSTLAVLGMGMNTYGPVTSYLEADDAGKEKMTDNYLKYMDWDSELPAFSKYLSEEQIQKARWRQEERRGDLLYDATGPVPDPDRIGKDGGYKSQKTYDQAVASRDKSLAEFEDFKLEFAPTYADALRLFQYHYTRDYTRPAGRAGGGGLLKKGTNTIKPGYFDRLPRLWALYESGQQAAP